MKQLQTVAITGGKVSTTKDYVVDTDLVDRRARELKEARLPRNLLSDIRAQAPTMPEISSASANAAASPVSTASSANLNVQDVAMSEPSAGPVASAPQISPQDLQTFMATFVAAIHAVSSKEKQSQAAPATPCMGENLIRGQPAQQQRADQRDRRPFANRLRAPPPTPGCPRDEFFARSIVERYGCVPPAPKRGCQQCDFWQHRNKQRRARVQGTAHEGQRPANGAWQTRAHTAAPGSRRPSTVPADRPWGQPNPQENPRPWGLTDAEWETIRLQREANSVQANAPTILSTLPNGTATNASAPSFGAASVASNS